MNQKNFLLVATRNIQLYGFLPIILQIQQIQIVDTNSDCFPAIYIQLMFHQQKTCTGKDAVFRWTYLLYRIATGGYIFSYTF